MMFRSRKLGLSLAMLGASRGSGTTPGGRLVTGGELEYIEATLGW